MYMYKNVYRSFVSNQYKVLNSLSALSFRANFINKFKMNLSTVCQYYPTIIRVTVLIDNFVMLHGYSPVYSILKITLNKYMYMYAHTTVHVIS